jgi:DNA-binding NtrC family response regulator
MTLDAGTNSRAIGGDSDDVLVGVERREARILWIDDEVRPDDPVLHALRLDGICTDVAASGSDGLRRAQQHGYELILLDLKLPDVFGLTVLQRLISSGTKIPVVIASGCYLEPELDEAALHLGAAGILHKPFISSESIQDAICRYTESGQKIEQPSVSATFHGIVGSSEALLDIIHWVERVAGSSASVLLGGETGTGKEVVARAIHSAGPRPSGPFVAVNCGAIPETLFESEVFGYRKGAFTGALDDKVGLLEVASGGTVFLDEVGEMPCSMQVRLLRSLESGQVRRLGDARERSIDVRVIAATNRSLMDEVARGRSARIFTTGCRHSRARFHRFATGRPTSLHWRTTGSANSRELRAVR